MLPIRRLVLLLVASVNIICGQNCPNKEFTFSFVVDGSASIQDRDWGSQKNFTARLVSSVYDLNNPTISLYQFGHLRRREVDCGDFTGDLTGLLAHINGLIQIQGATGIGFAVRDASDYMLNTAECLPNRANLSNVMLVLTDGRETVTTPTEAEVFYQQAKAAGITIYAVGVGPAVNPDELLEVASDENKRFIIEQFDGLTDAVVLEIYNAIVGTHCGSVDARVGNWMDDGNVCSKACNDLVDPLPFKTQTRECLEPGGDCGTTPLTRTVECNRNVGCNGTYGSFGNWSTCPATCNTNPSSPPQQTRTRTCVGATLNGGCDGPDTETRNCSVNIPCNGNWGPWTDFSACTETCQSDPNVIPTRTRNRTCVGSTLGGLCEPLIVNGVSYNGTWIEECNVNKSCQGNAQACSSKYISWIFVLDSSASVGSNEYIQQKAFFKNLTDVSSFGTNPNTEIGIVNFGTESQIEATCREFTTKQQIKDKLDSLPQLNDQTGIHRALNNSLIVSKGCTQTANREILIVFLTDGVENVDPKEITEPIDNEIRTTPNIHISFLLVNLNDAQAATFDNFTENNKSTINRYANFGEVYNINAEMFRIRTLSLACEVAGEWSAWVNGTCSTTCGPGKLQRTRVCRNVLTGAVQSDCDGLDNETLDCNLGYCEGNLTQWTEWYCPATCNIYDDVNNPPQETRTRECIGATGPGNCSNEARFEKRDCATNGCPGVLGPWSEYGQCSATCNAEPINVFPQQNRTRECFNDTLDAGCNETLIEFRNCSTMVGCPGQWSNWVDWSACSAECQLGNQSPTRYRNRTCVGFTFNGTCPPLVLNGISYYGSQIENCNSEKPCNGTLTEFVNGTCPESCNAEPIDQPPMRTDTRECVNASFGGDCFGAVLSRSVPCNEFIGCTGILGPWSEYGQCSATCNAEPINDIPQQNRTRECLNATLGLGCNETLIEFRDCSAMVGCPGQWSDWDDWSACSAECQLGSQSPTRYRNRTCEGSTFNATCPPLVLNGISYYGSQTENCNSEKPCNGTLTEYVNGTCPESCNAEPTDQPPMRTDMRECVNASFGGNCLGASLNRSVPCNVNVGCPGVLTPWVNGTCPATCNVNDDVANPPLRLDTRECVNSSLDGNCNNANLSRNVGCNVNVGCPGQWSNWTEYSTCSATCQLGSQSPTQFRTRVCENSTLGATCPPLVLNGIEYYDRQVQNCFSEEPCPGVLTPWMNGTCPVTCNVNDNVTNPPLRLDTRECLNTSFGGNCNNSYLNRTVGCNVDVGCPGILTPWMNGTCPATCQLNETQPLYLRRSRQCANATLTEDCNGADLEELVICNFQVPCPGNLTGYGPFTECSATCQSDPYKVPTRSRQRYCKYASFGGDCNRAPLLETVNCSEKVICPVPGSWLPWGEYGLCSKSCDQGVQVRYRNCSIPYPPGAGDNCTAGDERNTTTCKIADCPVVCQITKKCECNDVAYLTSAPVLNQTMHDMIKAALELMYYWTADVQKQICEACRIKALEMHTTTVNSQIMQVETLLNNLKMMKRNYRDTITCNENLWITSDLWTAYDMIWERCSVLEGVLKELKACKMRFDAALEACKSYDWFNTVMTKMFRKA